MFGLFPSPPFNPNSDIPDLSGKVIVITGGNSGLGKESLIHLAKHNPTKVYLCARSEEKYDAAMKDITAAVPSASSFVKYLELDLSSLASVKTAAATLISDTAQLDILMNNAGIMACPPALTKEGYETQFGTNHMGHFLFTKQLLPLLQKTAADNHKDVRIINLTSWGHKMAPSPTGFVPSTTTTDMASYSTWTRYGQSKLANILFTLELARRYPTITSVAIHPGSVQTNLANSFLKQSPWLDFVVQPVRHFVSIPADRGAWNQTWAAVAPLAAAAQSKENAARAAAIPVLQQGKYYNPVARADPPSSFAQDPNLALELWEWSEAELEKHGY